MTLSETIAKFRMRVEYYGKMARKHYEALDSKLETSVEREVYQIYNAQHLAWSEAADMLEQMDHAYPVEAHKR